MGDPDRRRNAQCGRHCRAVGKFLYILYSTGTVLLGPRLDPLRVELDVPISTFPDSQGPDQPSVVDADLYIVDASQTTANDIARTDNTGELYTRETGI